MAYIGSEIVQSRIWIDPNDKPLPSLNYKLTYPVTVFDAVREDMYDEESTTLTQTLEKIYTELRGKQEIIPAKPANNLVTYGGIAGAIGSIELTTHIPYDIDLQSDKKVPTEKAIGRLLQEYGIIPGEGHIPDIVLWKDIVGRPVLYDSTGDDENGVITQAGITSILTDVNNRIEYIWDNMDSSPLGARLREHINDTNNPHNITPAAIGAISRAEFENHTNDQYNPHHVTAAQVGLDKVDNTSDYDKPISRSTQAAIDQLNELISNITGLIGDIKYVVNIDYTQSNGRLDVRYNDGSLVGVTIVTDGLIDEIIPDTENHSLIIQELNGTRTSINIQDLITAYIGSEGTHINIEVEDSIIHADIVPKSITAVDIRDGTLINSLFANKTISGDKIQDLTITTRNLANGIITSDKISDGTITGGKIDTRTITGRNLFTTNIGNSVLAVTTANGDAEWSKVTGSMIDNGTITGSNIASNTIKSDNIQDESIISAKLGTDSVTTIKLANGAVTSEKIHPGTLTGTEFSGDSEFPGTPTLANTPNYDVLGKELVNAEWVRYVMEHCFTMPDRSILGRHLFTSDTKDRVLAVVDTNSDPIYTQINSGMLGTSSVITEKLADGSVTTIKIDDDAVTANKIAINSITSQKISEGEVKSINIFASDEPNMILGVDDNTGHPLYTKVTTDMISPDAVTNDKISEHAVTADKIMPPDDSNVILSYLGEGHSPEWSKVTSDFIADRSIIADKLFTSVEPNMILAVTTSGSSPVWTKITDDMIDHITFDADSLLPGSITHEKLADRSIDSNNLTNNSVGTENIRDESITAAKLFQPDGTSKILGISKDDSSIGWTTIETDMLQDHLITPSKMWQSTEDHVILGTVGANSNPEYIKLNEEWFEDHAFTSRKLAENLILYGRPTLDEHPADTSNDHSIADTAWVNAAIEAAIESGGGGGTPDWHDLPDDTLALSKLVHSDEKDKVIAVTEDGGLPRYTQVTEGMLENGSITRDKLDRDLELLGAPKLEIRPPDTAADENGNGDLIPDTQWVRNKITEQVVDAFEHYVPPQDRFSRILSAISEERITELLDGGAEGSDRPDLRDEFSSIVERIDAEMFVNAYDSGTRITDSSQQFYIRDREYQPIQIDRIEGIVRGTITPKSIDDYQFAEVIPGPAPAVLGPKAVITEYINDRAVTGTQLFTTPHENSVLAVTWPNEDPIWTKITHPMLDTGIISIENFMATALRDKVLGLDGNGVPSWMAISGVHLAPGSVTEDKLANGAVTSEKIRDFSIGANKFKGEPIFNTEHLFDNAITTRKIADRAITADKIADGAIFGFNIANGTITSGKLEDAIVLPKNATVKSADNDRKSLRNITVSADLPVGCTSGEIWFQYVT